MTLTGNDELSMVRIVKMVKSGKMVMHLSREGSLDTLKIDSIISEKNEHSL